MISRPYVLDKVHENTLWIYTFRIDAELYHEIDGTLYRVHLYPVGFSYNNVAIYKLVKKKIWFINYERWEMLTYETGPAFIIYEVPRVNWFILRLKNYLYENNTHTK